MRKVVINRPIVAVAVLAVLSAMVGFGWGDESAQANYLCVSARCKAAEAAAATANIQRDNAASEKIGYQSEVNRLAAEVAGIQAEIDKNDEQIVELGRQIENTERKIERLKESIKSAIVKMYLNDAVSELEILASSSSVVDFTTKTANQEIIQTKVKQLAFEAKQAKTELEQQKVEQEQMKADNEARRSVVATKQAEQQTFVDLWAGRESEYAETAQANVDIVAAESWQQYLQNQRELNSGGGGSSWPVYSGPNTYPGQGICPGTKLYADYNTWGNGYICQCTSYAGWKAYEYAGYGHPSYHQAWGDARLWAYSAGNRGLSVGSEPRSHSIGVSNKGSSGHVFWVEWVTGNIVHISEYNYGRYEDFGSREFTIDYSYSRGYKYIYL
jgi:surface antigen/peptidoglycan hydrolase CwlO-like protein